MFIRVKTTPNSPRKTVQIVESVRDGNKVKQRIVRYIGVAENDQELEKLKDVAQFVKARIEDERHPLLIPPEQFAQLAIESKKRNQDKLLVDLKELKEEQRSIVGIHEVYGKVYKELFPSILKARNRKAEEILYHIVMARIANPASKRASVLNLESDFGVSLNLDRVYRMMDKIDDKVCASIQRDASLSTNQILGGKIDVLFIDATTLYFESFTEDDFKQNGYSKDLKFNQPQVLLALMVTKQGLPIGYEAFPGSTYEGNTLLSLLKKIKQNHEIDKIIFVADSAMFNEKNLSLLEKEGYEYIVGARLKSLPKSLKEDILDLSKYKICFSEEKDDTTSIRELQHNQRRLIVTHNTKRARKDAHDREKAIEKLIKKLNKSKNPEQFISNYGYKKFLKIKNNMSVSLDEEKVLQQKRWDGLHGVITNAKDLSAQEIITQYKGLWQVEESFRITKHDLKVRPIFHWTPNRIRAHIAICFLAFSCIRHLEYRTQLQYKKLSPEKIRKALMCMQVSILKDSKGNRYAIPSQGTQDSRKLYQVMHCHYSTVPYKIS